ncbi:MAG: hypothetical protein U1C33_06465 [Candidatus Cloacimonadaceae bacterium]|nr:hypothetical protein [Candidatus Cloacimonadaceae bacterium]
MKQTMTLSLIVAVLILSIGCLSKENDVHVISNVNSMDLEILIEPGEHWIHKMPILGFLKMKNRPQIAIWVEDDAGNFVQNLYVTRKTATQGWLKGPGDPTPKNEIRRYESLPYWMHRQNHEFEPGILMPTKKHPLPAFVTSATPKGRTNIIRSIADSSKTYIIHLEINQSTDFNDFYAANKKAGETGYNGGKWGSGQPSMVYTASINQDSEGKEIIFQLLGHGSPDGSDGKLYEDMGKISTATSIIKYARLNAQTKLDTPFEK